MGVPVGGPFLRTKQFCTQIQTNIRPSFCSEAHLLTCCTDTKRTDNFVHCCTTTFQSLSLSRNWLCHLFPSKTVPFLKRYFRIIIFKSFHSPPERSEGPINLHKRKISGSIYVTKPWCTIALKGAHRIVNFFCVSKIYIQIKFAGQWLANRPIDFTENNFDIFLFLKMTFFRALSSTAAPHRPRLFSYGCFDYVYRGLPFTVLRDLENRPLGRLYQPGPHHENFGGLISFEAFIV